MKLQLTYAVALMQITADEVAKTHGGLTETGSSGYYASTYARFFIARLLCDLSNMKFSLVLLERYLASVKCSNLVLKWQFLNRD